MAGKDNLVPFKKDDIRCWRKGRPKTFKAWRDLTASILCEPYKDRNGKTVIEGDHLMTNAEHIAREWLKDPKHQLDLVEAAVGKVPTPVDITSGGEKIQIVKVGIDIDKL